MEQSNKDQTAVSNSESPSTIQAWPEKRILGGKHTPTRCLKFFIFNVPAGKTATPKKDDFKKGATGNLKKIDASQGKKKEREREGRINCKGPCS
jgi:hypothetical protein